MPEYKRVSLKTSIRHQAGSRGTIQYGAMIFRQLFGGSGKSGDGRILGEDGKSDERQRCLPNAGTGGRVG